VLHPAFRRHNTATCVDSHQQRRSFAVDTVHIANLNRQLHREHEQLKGMLWHHTLVSVDEGARAKHAKSNIPIDGIFAEGHAIAPCPELSLDLCNHLRGRLAIFLWLHPLFGNESGRTCVGLGVYGLVLPLILFADLLLVRCFLHLPLGRREDTSINPTHHDDASNQSKRRPCCRRHSHQGQ